MTSNEDVSLEVLGRQLRINTSIDPHEIDKAVAIIENTFRDMEGAYELKWGTSPSGLDTSSWLIIGALNIAHRVVRLEKEACQNAQNLESTLSRLLSHVPDEG